MRNHTALFRSVTVILLAGALACSRSSAATPTPGGARRPPPVQTPAVPDRPIPPPGGTRQAQPPEAGLAVATFAGGCFWCMEAPFERLPGVRAVLSGYTGGPEAHPTYDAVSNHRTGHAEAVRILYDPALITYDRLLEVFWRQIDPTAVDRMFVDVGRQYRGAIFVHSPEQRAAALRSRAALAASHRFAAPIRTAIEDAGPFWIAEDYHQDFYRTHPERYHEYRSGSGRDAFIRRYWGSAPDAH